MGEFRITGNYVYRNCKYCNYETTSSTMPKHEKHCYLNPGNTKLCPVCNAPIKNYKENKTCSHACSNTMFRSGENHPNWKFGDVKQVSYHTYRKICFKYNQEECIICGEKLLVEVHHYDGNRSNNTQENLVPLCPTHHKYWHSKFKHLIKEQMDNYVNNLKLDRDIHDI